MNFSTLSRYSYIDSNICINNGNVIEELLMTQTFLDEEDPLERLPNKYTHWETTANILPQLISQILDEQCPCKESKYFEARQLLEKIPQCEISDLITIKARRRAILLLGIFAHTWVWLPYVSGISNKPEYFIPHQIAVPLYQISQTLNRPPVLTNSDLFDYNWKRKVSNKGLDLDNLDIINGFIQNDAEKYFYLIFFVMNVKGIPATRAMLEVQDLLRNLKFISELALLEIKKRLDIVIESLAKIRETLSQVFSTINHQDWFKKIRWFSVGWNNQDMFPNGVLYEGVEDYSNQGQFFFGPSGFQYPVFQCIDAFLDIRHEAYINQVNARFYMPSSHVKIINAIENSPNIRTLLTEHRIGSKKFLIDSSNKTYQSVVESYNNCIRQVKNIRALHFGVASKYLTKMILQELEEKIILTTGGQQDNHERLLRGMVSYHRNQII